MNILLFGISNVGKSVTASLLASQLGCAFYDLDDEVKKHMNTTLETFVHTGTLGFRDSIRVHVMEKIIHLPEAKVFSICPISYSEYYHHLLDRQDIFAIELQDLPEHIFERLVFSNEHDELYHDIDYKYEHIDRILLEISSDIEYYSQCFSKIEHKFFMNNDAPEQVVERLIKDYQLTHLLNKS